mgnify:CR=1 FL=1
MAVKELVRDVVVLCIPQERKEKSELTLSSFMSPFLQMIKLRHLPTPPEYLASGAILEEVGDRSRSLGPVHWGWDRASMPFGSQANVMQMSVQRAPVPQWAAQDL